MRRSIIEDVTRQEFVVPDRAPAHIHNGRDGRKIMRAVGLVLLSLVLIITGAAVSMYSSLQGNISQHDIDDLVDVDDRPTENQIPLDEKAGEPLNILVMGADRKTDDGMRSDTTMLVHISAGRDRVDVVSIPRDTLVNIPECILPDGTRTPAEENAMFNSAFNNGSRGGNIASAAACTVRTVEDLTGVYIDGFVVLDFNSFRDVVNTLGGIEMCFAEPINDPQAHLEIDAGCHTLDGDQALAVARVRKSLGDGSDIGRISRQHQVVTAIAEKVFSLNVFTNLPEFYGLLQDVTAHVEMSRGMGDIPWLAGLMYSLRSLGSNDINSVTMPWAPAGARVVPAPEAQQVWDALIKDQPIPEEALNTDHSPSIIINATPEELDKAAARTGSAVGL